MGKKKITIIIPAFNEEENLPHVYERVTKVIESLPRYDFEMLLIDNSSEDRTGEISKSYASKDPRWRYIRFSRNFTFEVSIAAGVHYAIGDAVIFLSSDLQDPPERIPDMIALWEESGADVVYGILQVRNDFNIFKTIGAKVAYRILAAMSEIQIPANGTDFRLITRPVMEAISRCHERNRFLRGLIHWAGFKQVAFEYDRADRKFGKSNANLIFCFNFLVTALVGFTSKPLRWASVMGVLVTMSSMVLAVFYATLHVLKLYNMNPLPTPSPGWATLVILILFFGGLQSLFLGIIGEYLGRVFTEVKARPLWVIEETAGYESASDPLKTRPYREEESRARGEEVKKVA